ncbi:hypothetical protein GCM10012286_16570 [Streptomyces lasiicapitis]|uniref:MFS transporter n=1 Tax=Streptomyces lasiicapitis TaxID=1923961 RepID=A0ABQ2LLL8_9ACTN|nr:hypothetical protein GCM10012286_16570 [Streptomyces lasiicapitis]
MARLRARRLRVSGAAGFVFPFPGFAGADVVFVFTVFTVFTGVLAIHSTLAPLADRYGPQYPTPGRRARAVHRVHPAPSAAYILLRDPEPSRTEHTTRGLGRPTDRPRKGRR